MHLDPRVTAILTRDPERGLSKAEVLEALAAELTWPALLANVLLILRDGSRRPEDWLVAAEVLWGAAIDERPMDENDVIAHLLLRYEIGSAAEDNLAWSIVARLKGEAYLSEYLPTNDPDVMERLAALHD